jgi:hypothetical protein
MSVTITDLTESRKFTAPLSTHETEDDNAMEFGKDTEGSEHGVSQNTS